MRVVSASLVLVETQTHTFIYTMRHCRARAHKNFPRFLLLFPQFQTFFMDLRQRFWNSCELTDTKKEKDMEKLVDFTFGMYYSTIHSIHFF